jgi:hypothetical protein
MKYYIILSELLLTAVKQFKNDETPRMDVTDTGQITQTLLH